LKIACTAAQVSLHTLLPTLLAGWNLKKAIQGMVRHILVQKQRPRSRQCSWLQALQQMTVQAQSRQSTQLSAAAFCWTAAADREV
jgi:hypothetical protein